MDAPCVCDQTEQAPVQYVQANGLRFAYLEEGKGPLLLFLHGFPDDARTYSRQLRFFAAAGYRAVAPFLRGYAPTEIPADGKYDPLTLGRDVEQLIAALSPSGRASVVGMDWGGTSIFATLATAPSSVQVAIVMATPHPITFLAIRKDPAAIHAMFHLYYFQTEGVEAQVGIDGLPFVDYLWHSWSPSLQDEDHIRSVKETLSAPGSLKAALTYYPAMFAAARSGQIAIKPTVTPTLTIYGSNDASGKYAAMEEQMFKGPYRRVVLDGVGHFPHREREHEVNALILGWLKDHAGN